MTMDRMTPLALVEVVAEALHGLCGELVFVGGAITGLLLTDPAARPPSATKDVDVIVSVTTRTEYLGSLSERMRALGFREDTSEDAPLCRWRWRDGIKLDLMPTDPTILGFSNRWFADAFIHARRCGLPSGKSIRVVTAPHFIATKLEAFLSRGGGDYMGSKDIEDLVAVLHGREEIVTDVLAASAELRAYLSSRLPSCSGLERSANLSRVICRAMTRRWSPSGSGGSSRCATLSCRLPPPEDEAEYPSKTGRPRRLHRSRRPLPVNEVHPMRLSSYSLVTLLLCAALPACTATCSVQKGSGSSSSPSHGTSRNDHDFSKPNGSGGGGGSKPNGSGSGDSKPNVADADEPASAEQQAAPDTDEAAEPEVTPKPGRAKAKPGRAKAKPKRAAVPVPVPEPAPAPDGEPIPLPEPVPVDPEEADPSGRGAGDGQGWVTPAVIDPDDGVDGGSKNVTPD
jgi:hypothetical protein